MAAIPEDLKTPMINRFRMRMIFEKCPVIDRAFLLILQVFFPGCKTASNMTLGLILFQNLPDLNIQAFIALPESLGQILMDSGF